MVLGSLNEVLEGDKTLYESIQQINNPDYKKPSRISSILSTLSHYGMSYEDKVYKNMVAVPADPSLQNKNELGYTNLYSGMYNGAQQTGWKIKSEEDKPFNQKSLIQKRNILRKMAQEPEIEDIIDIMTNECIVYDSDEAYVCLPFMDNAVIQDLNEKALDEVRTAVDTVFYQIYLLLRFKQNAWNVFRRFIIDGVISYEIVFDSLENPHTIIGLVDIDPATLTKVTQDGTTYWIQYKGMSGKERKLLDSQIIYIKYEDSGVAERQSYLERLIRPFNIYRIIEQAQVIWTVTQSSFKTMFTIPVNGMNKAKGLQTLNAAMNRYREDITFNNETGELKVNGKVNMPFNKEFWMPENENGKPQIETIVDNGPQLNDSEQLKFFASKLYKISKIPESRFDKEAGASWFGTDPSQALRDEINFGRFTARLRSTFGEIILKPLRIQIALQIPELKNDKRILDSISLRWNSYNQFQELMEQQIDQTRMEFIQALRDTFTSTDEDGNDVSYFCDKYLLVKYLKMSDADLELNAKYKMEEKLAKEKMENGEAEDTKKDEDSEDGDLEDEDLFGGDEEEEGNSKEDKDKDSEADDLLGDEETPEEDVEPEDNTNDIDKEMLGNVKPEKVEKP